jgi:hypothetical protein
MVRLSLGYPPQHPLFAGVKMGKPSSTACERSTIGILDGRRAMGRGRSLSSTVQTVRNFLPALLRQRHRLYRVLLFDAAFRHQND